MRFRFFLSLFLCVAFFYAAFSAPQVVAQQQAVGRERLPAPTVEDWNRYYYYPYRYFPHNFQSRDYHRAMANPPQRYPKEMQVPARYDQSWQNYFPAPRKYHFGRHFHLDML